jgi:hypothetical protein
MEIVRGTFLKFIAAVYIKERAFLNRYFLFKTTAQEIVYSGCPNPKTYSSLITCLDFGLHMLLAI